VARNLQNQLSRTPHAFKLSSKLFEFSLNNMFTFIAERASDSNIDDKMKTGFNNIENCLNVYFDQLDVSFVDDSKLTIYGSATLENGAIIRATNSYHKRSWFSDVSVRMNFEELLEYPTDQGICYGQVINQFC
jgi:hypothetical protein